MRTRKQNSKDVREKIFDLSKKTENSRVDIYDLLSKADKKEEKKNRRAELLESMGIADYFEEGSIKINMRTCRGIECNLCVKACPTNALYWKAGEIGIEEDLCIHCTSCVLNCCVDNCIHVIRKRPDGKTESFSTPKDVIRIISDINSTKRIERVESRSETIQEYLGN
jgi:Fe-S-cluster-containing hydrogenase component 2